MPGSDDALRTPWPTGRRRPARTRASADATAARIVLRLPRRPPPPPQPVDLTKPRPPVRDDGSLLGFSRFTWSKFGGRVYRAAIIALYSLIFVEMLAAMLDGISR